MPTSLLEVVMRLKDEISDRMRKVSESVKEVEKNFSSMERVTRAAANALMAYGSIRVIGNFIESTRRANQLMLQTRMTLNLLGKETADKLMPIVVKTGKEMENWGVDNEEASLAMARLTVKMKDTSKAMEWLDLLTKFHRLDVMNLETSSRLFMGTVEDSHRALVYLARSIGLEVNPEYEDMDEILRKLQKTMKGLDFSSLGLQIDKFKVIWKDIKEKVGAPFLETVNTILGGINWLIDRFPVLKKVIADTLFGITTAITGFLAGEAIRKFLSFFNITLEAAGAWGLAIGVIIGAVILIWTHFKDEIIGALKTVKEKLIEFYNSHKETFDNIQKQINDFISLALIPLKAAWDILKDALISLWNALKDLGKAIWDLIQVLSPVLIPILKFLADFLKFVLGTAIMMVVGALSFLIVIFGVVVDVIAFVIEFISKLIDWFAKLIKKIGEVITNKEKLKETFLTVWNNIWKGFEPIYNAIMGWIGNIVNMAEKAITKLREAAQWVGGKLGITSKQLGGYIPETGLYLLHQGEYVVPRGRAAYAYAGAGIGGINITITGNTFMSDEDAAVKIGDMIIKALKRNIKI